jgi:hypothetical protein
VRCVEATIQGPGPFVWSGGGPASRMDNDWDVLREWAQACGRRRRGAESLSGSDVARLRFAFYGRTQERCSQRGSRGVRRGWSVYGRCGGAGACRWGCPRFRGRSTPVQAVKASRVRIERMQPREIGFGLSDSYYRDRRRSIAALMVASCSTAYCRWIRAAVNSASAIE